MNVKLKFLEDSEVNVCQDFNLEFMLIWKKKATSGSALQFDVFMLFLVYKFCSIFDYNRSHDQPSGNMEWSQAPSSPNEPSLLQGGAPD